MERLLRIASPLGLYAEEFDAETGRHLGNFPQAFSHLALIEAAGRIIVPEMLAGATERWTPTTSSSSAPAPAAARSHGTWRPRASESCCSSAATGFRASRRTGPPQEVFVDNRYVSPDTWYDAKGKPFQPQVHYFVGGATKLYGAALYRLRERGLRRAQTPRRRLAGLADLLRRARAVLHAGRAALPGARRSRRRPDRAAGERAVSVPGGLARAAHPAALGRPRGGRLSPVPRAVRHQAERGEHAVQHVHPLRDLRRLPLPRAREVRRRGARRAARARAPERRRC